MDIGSILLGLALLLVVTFVVLRPMLEQRAAPEPEEGAADQLLLRREQVLTQLRDLDFDHATGKFNEEDYAAQRAQLVAEGVAILKELDAQGIEAAAVGGNGRPAAPELDEIEAAIAQRRTRPAVPPPDEIEAAIGQRRQVRAAAASPSCPNCSAAVQPADRFCPKCGTALTATPRRARPAKAVRRR